jgi:DAACS family dicarboxylate/amino acid:cation (Na+ or H+) symporter
MHGEEVKFITDAKMGVSDLMLSMLPENIFAGLAHGDLVPIIIFCIVTAVALASVPGGQTILKHVQTLLSAILLVTHWVMELAPFGVFALITKTVAIGGIDSLSQYGAFVMTVLGALFTLLFVVGSLMVHFGTDFTPLQFFTGMREAMLTAFSTSSSAATIPVSLETVEKEFGVPERVASFLIPLATLLLQTNKGIEYEGIHFYFKRKILTKDCRQRIVLTYFDISFICSSKIFIPSVKLCGL